MRFVKPIAAVLAVGIGAASLVGTADAARYWHRHHNGAGIAAAGIVGLAAGALVGSALAQPYYYQPAPVYVAPPPPVVYQTAPVYYVQPRPWSPAWYQSCGQRYQSFDSRTGYYLGYDGNYHFCN